MTGAHAAHASYCDTCHRVPDGSTPVEVHASGNAGPIVQLAGLAASGGSQPTWDPSSQRCSAVYCHHDATTPAWTDPASLACDGCHGAPPASHARWSRVASGAASCTSCHPGPTDPRHVNGRVDLTVTSCTACHGAGDHPNPPSALDGATDPTSRGVGAHARHLDGTLGDRIGKALACNDCHDVPNAVGDPGHLEGAPARVRFPFGGAYDTTNQTCTVWCHFDRTPARGQPVWTDATGAARACDACHAFPPRLTRTGTPHPSVAGDLAECLKCHVYQPSTHVNGVVDYVQP
jgi:predicted CxxxxCH...CXXCH cytochrome family protein